MKGIHITGEERQLLWSLLQHDTVNTIRDLIVNPMTVGEKVARITGQMDFVFQLRVTIANTAQSGGGIWLNELAQKYLIGIIEEARVADLRLEVRAIYYKLKEQLLFKLGDQDRAQVGLIAAQEGEKTS